MSLDSDRESQIPEELWQKKETVVVPPSNKAFLSFISVITHQYEKLWDKTINYNLDPSQIVLY